MAIFKKQKHTHKTKRECILKDNFHFFGLGITFGITSPLYPCGGAVPPSAGFSFPFPVQKSKDTPPLEGVGHSEFRALPFGSSLPIETHRKKNFEWIYWSGISVWWGSFPSEYDASIVMNKFWKTYSWMWMCHMVSPRYKRVHHHKGVV